MKKNLFFGITLTLLLVLALSTVSLAAEYTLRLSDHDIKGGLKGAIGEYWFNEVEKQTDGRVKIQAYWGGTLASASEQLSAVSKGIVDIAAIYPDFYPKQLPLFGAFWLFPQGPEKWENIAWIYDTSIERIDEFQRELDKAGIKILLKENGLPMAFFATYPIDDLDDLKGYKWRAGDRWNLKLLANQGATAISVPWGDCYMALETGTVDGVMSNYDGMHRQKFDEPADYILAGKSIGWSQPMFYAINKDKWDNMPAELQEGILKASENTEKAFAAMYNEAFEQIVEAQREAGNTVKLYGPEDAAQYADEDCLEGLRATFVKELKDAGVSDGAQMLEELKGIIQEAIAKESN